MDILCKTIIVKYFLVSSDIPSLVYYSHLPLLLISLVIVLTIIIRREEELLSKALLFIFTSFGIWTFLSLISWTSNKGDVIMFVWSMIILVEPFIHISCIYLSKTLIEGKGFNLGQRWILFLLYLPVIILLPTRLTLLGFNLETCSSIEGPIGAYYTYLIECIYLIWIVIYTTKKILSAENKQQKIKIIHIAVGVLTFLIIFTLGNIIGSFTGDWSVAGFGLLGMPVFIGFFIYNTFKYNLFNFVSTNIFIVILLILILSLLTISDIYISRIVISITFLISLGIGIILIRSIKRERDNLLQISSLASSLESLNSNLSEKVIDQTKEISRAYNLEKKALRELQKLSETKDKFIMIAQHNLRVPITSLQNKVKTLGRLSDLEQRNEKDVANIQASIDHLTDIADDFKNIAQLRVGSNVLNLSKVSLEPAFKSVMDELKIDIETMGVETISPIGPAHWPVLHVDENKIKEVLLVILENAVKYNKQNGSIVIETEVNNDYFIIRIKNTGFGITSEENSNLFSRSFYRSERVKNLNPTGMGIGLSLSRTVVEAHHGTLTLNSEGENKGTLVTVTLPIDFMQNLNQES